MVDISYSPSTLDVAAGETVRFIFHDDGSVRHDAVVGDAEVPAKHETEVRAAATAPRPWTPWTMATSPPSRWRLTGEAGMQIAVRIT